MVPNEFTIFELFTDSWLYDLLTSHWRMPVDAFDFKHLQMLILLDITASLPQCCRTNIMATYKRNHKEYKYLYIFIKKKIISS